MNNANFLTDLSVFQANFLALVAWADGVITEEEKEFYSQIVELSPCSDKIKNELQEYISTSPKLDEVMLLTENLSKEIIIPVLRSAYLMSASDGSIDTATCGCSFK